MYYVSGTRRSFLQNSFVFFCWLRSQRFFFFRAFPWRPSGDAFAKFGVQPTLRAGLLPIAAPPFPPFQSPFFPATQRGLRSNPLPLPQGILLGLSLFFFARRDMTRSLATELVPVGLFFSRGGRSRLQRGSPGCADMTSRAQG
jgi:hypothetical protein